MNDRIADDLESAVDAAVAELGPLSEPVVSHRPTPDRWTIKEVIGHLIDSASNNHQRFVRAQFVKEFTFPMYEQNQWVQCQFYNEVPWADLLTLWRAYNHHLAHVMRKTPADALGVRCIIGTYEPMTLGFLMEDYVVHLKHHLEKIRERIASR